MVKNKNPRIKNLIIVSSVAVLAGTGLWLGFLRDDAQNLSVTPTDASSTDTDESKKTNQGEPEDRKKALPGSDDGQNNPPDANTSTQKSVKPLITSWGQTSSGVEVSAYVPNVIEDGGTCTLTLTKGDKQVSAKRKGISNVSTTSCGTLFIEEELSAGTWQATVSYSSTKAKGVSNPIDITIE